MSRSILIGTLCLALLGSTVLVIEGPQVTMAANSPASAPQDQQPTSVRPGSTEQSRSYAREVHSRRKHRISKGEVIFMAGVAGTSMGIGAIAGGGMGLAIGAIVGGWGAYASHRMWHWINK